MEIFPKGRLVIDTELVDLGRYPLKVSVEKRP